MLMTSEIVRQPTRLFVGGLPHDVSSEQIAQRFKPFGTVEGVELAPEKEGSVTAGPILKPCRGFAFLQFTPKDDAALHRCVSMVRSEEHACSQCACSFFQQCRSQRDEEHPACMHQHRQNDLR